MSTVECCLTGLQVLPLHILPNLTSSLQSIFIAKYVDQRVEFSRVRVDIGFERPEESSEDKDRDRAVRVPVTQLAVPDASGEDMSEVHASSSVQ